MEVQTLEKACDALSAPGAMPLEKEKTECRNSPDPQPRLSAAGAGALLFDPSTGIFDAVTQTRLLAVAMRIEATFGVKGTAEVILGVNNLLFIFNPLELHPDGASAALLRLWETTEARPVSERVIELPVIYGGAAGEDLVAMSIGAGLTVDDYVRRHSEATYAVACIGAMPGFAYMTGLPPELSAPRRHVPRTNVERGTVMVGGAQTGVMPCTAPSGWHMLGRTDICLFDVKASPPCLFEPGDRVQFVVKGVQA
jgi:5-oxoprolinase (ATP-hydrolysing) subunit B